MYDDDLIGSIPEDYIPDWFFDTNWNKYLWRNIHDEVVDVRTINPYYAYNLSRYLNRVFDFIQTYCYYLLDDSERIAIESSNLYKMLIKKGGKPSGRY